LRKNVNEYVRIYDSTKTNIIAVFFATMICAIDPWRQPDGLDCGSFRVILYGRDPHNIQGALYANNPTVPASSRLSPQARATVNQQYARHAQLRNLQNTPGGATTKSLAPSAAQKALTTNTTQASQQAILIGPLTITQPAANGTVIQGKFQ